jgi:hypothetical protein
MSQRSYCCFVVVLVFDIVDDVVKTLTVEGIDDKLDELDVRSARL